jgi:hypothetical protein
MLSEKISNFGLLGCLLIFCGLIVSETYNKKKIEQRFSKSRNNY